MSVELIAELATSHGGNVDLACDMVNAAADSGAHTVKIQSYTLARLNSKDPQADWLRQAYLDEKAHERVMKACELCKVQFLSTPFDRESLMMLLRLNQGRIKVASTQTVWNVTRKACVMFLKSWAWGLKPSSAMGSMIEADLTAIPLYPAPLECIYRAPLLDGYSDHTVGIAACKHMLSKGARIIEAHFCLPGKSRQMLWDKTPEQFREIRDWADAVETMTSGVSQQFRERWSA